MPTPTEIISRSQLTFPNLGHDGGAGLETRVKDMWIKVGDNANSRYFVEENLANSASVDFEHNLKCAFAELRTILYGYDSGTGQLTRLVSGGSPDLDDFTVEATPGDTTTQVRVTNSTGSEQDIALVVIHGRGAENLDDLDDVDTSGKSDGQALVYSTSSSKWVPGAGGGGGGSLIWNALSGYAPTKIEEYGETVYMFDPNAPDSEMVAYVKVPQSYTGGKQIKLYIGIYSPAASGNVKMQSRAYLIRESTESIDATTNSRLSTNTEITNTSGKQYRSLELDLSDSSGEINGVSISSGDILKIRLKRDVSGETSSDSEETRFMPNGTEVTFS